MPRTREPLTLDQQRVLDEVARLYGLGFDAPPGTVAHTLGMPLERVATALEELCRLGLELHTGGRVPPCSR